MESTLPSLPRRLRSPRAWFGLLLASATLAAVPARASEDESGRRSRPDPHRIINESMSFLKEREPDLSAVESALYDNARNQRPEVAIKLIDGLLASKNEKPASPAFLVLLGNIHYASGAIDRAESSYLQAVERYPTFLRAWTNLGVLHYAQKRYANAIPCFAKAVTLGARESTTFGMMAECLEKAGDGVGAEVAYIQALAGDPGNTEWMEGLLRVYLEARQYPRAEVMVRKLIQEQPREPRHWLAYAKLLHGDGRKLEAIALLEQSLATGVAGDKERLELAGLYADQQLVAEAMQSLGKIKVTAAALGETRGLQFARLLIARAEWTQAQALLDELRPKVSSANRAEFSLTQADLRCAQRHWPDARALFDEVLKNDPMNGRALIGLGRVYAAEGDAARATLAFETATQTRDGARAASVELAHLELRHRHFAKSVSYLEAALAFEKNPGLEEILERVRALATNEVEREI